MNNVLEDSLFVSQNRKLMECNPSSGSLQQSMSAILLSLR